MKTITQSRNTGSKTVVYTNINHVKDVEVRRRLIALQVKAMVRTTNLTLAQIS